MSSSAIDSPRPVPPLVRARAGSARQNRLNTIADSPGAEPDAVVADGDRGGVVVAGDVDHDADVRTVAAAWSIALVTRLRTIRSTRRTSASARQAWSGARTTTRTPRCSASAAGRVDDPVRDVDEVDVVEVEHRGAGVEAADLEQVGEQRLEPVELGLQQLGGPGGGRVEAGAGVVQHVAGHPDRGQRGAQLVGDVGDEAALDPAELLELADLALQVAWPSG